MILKEGLFGFLQLKQSLEQKRTETSNKEDSPFYEVVRYTVKTSQVGTEAIYDASVYDENGEENSHSGSFLRKMKHRRLLDKRDISNLGSDSRVEIPWLEKRREDEL